MYRREVLQSAATVTASLAVPTTSVAARTVPESTPPEVLWRTTYEDISIASVVPAHGDGCAVVSPGRGRRSDAEIPVRIAVVDEDGAIRQSQEITPDGSKNARRASADLVRTENGYAVAMGAWIATLDTDLSVKATGVASEYKDDTNSTTLLVELADGFAVAAESNGPSHVSVNVLGFDSDLNLQWTQEYGRWDATWLEFLLDDLNGGLVVGGRTSKPVVWNVAADGTRRSQTALSDIPSSVASDAVSDGDGVTLFGDGNVVRLNDSWKADWRQSYDAFDDTFDGQIARTTAGEYLIAAETTSDDDMDPIRVGRVDATGELQWSETYTVGEHGEYHLNGIVERARGEYLVFGYRRDAPKGWAFLVSESESALPPELTPTETPTKTPPPTTDTPTETPPSTISMPGFGVKAALAGIVGGLVARYR